MSEYKRWPMGLQTGPTGQPDGIGEVIRALTDAKIAMFSAASDSMSIIYDLQKERKETGVPHTGNYIPTGYIDGYHMSVPHHGHPPTVEGAVWHWDHIEKRGLPKEIDWDMPCIWLSTWNEVRPYVGWARMDSGKPDEDPVDGFEGNADWMGWQAVETGKEAIKRGYRWAAFGFAGGDPEPGFWEAPGVLEYLHLCEKHPEHLGVALHEYSHIKTILNEPEKIGRFKQLHAACDKHGIRRPVIQIKEFGWEAFDAPEPEIAIDELIEVAEMYMEHPNIHGAAIWTVQDFHGGAIRRAVKPIIPFLKDAALQNAQPIPELKLPGDGIQVDDIEDDDDQVDDVQVGDDQVDGVQIGMIEFFPGAKGISDDAIGIMKTCHSRGLETKVHPQGVEVRSELFSDNYAAILKSGMVVMVPGQLDDAEIAMSLDQVGANLLSFGKNPCKDEKERTELAFSNYEEFTRLVGEELKKFNAEPASSIFNSQEQAAAAVVVVGKYCQETGSCGGSLGGTC